MKLHSTSSIAAVAFMMTVSTAHAQVDQAAEDSAAKRTGVQDIIVTARRSQERLQDVPVAVSALEGDDIRALDIRNFGDLGRGVPNLVTEKQLGTSNSATFYLRGISTGSLKFQTDAGIGLYINGVYLGRPAASSFDLADIERIEVLRGPQGTLFGRNSTGGAINFITRAPTGEFHLRTEGQIGNYDARNFRIAVDLPAVGPLSARVTYLHNENRGYVRNLAAGRTYTFAEPFGTIKSVKDFGFDNTDAAGLAARLDFNDLVIDYNFDFTDKVNSTYAQQLIAFNPTFGGGAFYAAPGLFTPPSLKRLNAIPLDITTPTRLRVYGHSVTASYDLTPDITFKSITAFRRFREKATGNDIDGAALDGSVLDPSLTGVPLSLFNALQVRRQRQFSEEAQLLGKLGNFDFVLGGMYFTESGSDNNPVFLGVLYPTSPIVPNVVGGDGNVVEAFGLPGDYYLGANSRVRNRSTAGYAHLSYKTEQFELAGGIRYTKDNRRETVIAAGLIPAVFPAGTFKSSGDNWDFDATATYIFQPRVRAYARFATGYLSGGIIAGNPFPKETIDSYEIGFKGDLFDNAVRLNAALFHTKRRNIQTIQFDAVRGFYMDSLPKGRENGAEVELTVVPVSGLTLGGNVGYMDQKLSLSPTTGIASPILAPKWSANVNVQYDTPAANNGSYWQMRLDGTYKDKRGIDLQGTPRNPGQLPARFDLNARAGLMNFPMGSGKAHVAVFGQNITNNKKLDTQVDLGTVILGVFQRPRTYGVEVGFEF